MANNVYDTSGGDDSWDLSAPPASAAPAAAASGRSLAAPYTAQVPGGASDSPFSFGNDPNAPGMFGMSRGFWRDIASLGANTITAANARTSGGFLANGTGFMGPFGAGVQETLAQGQKNAVAQSEINARNTQTMGEGLKNAGLAAGLPLLQFQNQQSLRNLQNPEEGAAWAKRQSDAYRKAFPTSGGGNNSGSTDNGGLTDNTGATGTDGGIAPTPYSRSIAGMEGVNRQNPEGSPEASAASSARGTGQFIDSTWLGFFHSNPGLFPQGTTDQQALAMRDDPKAGPALGHAAINWLGTQNASALQKSGVDVTGQSLGIAHWLGSTATAAVMKADDQTPVKDVLYQSLPAATADAYMKANPQLAGYTVGALKTRYANIPTPPFGTQIAGNGRVQVAQAGGAVPTQAQKNADAIVAGQTQAQTGTPAGTTTTAQATTPGYTAQQGYAKAQSYLREAALNEQILSAWEQRVKSFANNKVMYFEPRPEVRDPAMLRTMAQQENQKALDVDAAGPQKRAESSAIVPEGYTRTANGTLVATPGGPYDPTVIAAKKAAEARAQAENENVSIRGPGAAVIGPRGITQSPDVYEVLGPDLRKWRITQNAVETGKPYVRPPDVPPWAPTGTLSAVPAEMSAGEAEGQKAAGEDAFGEKSRAQYASALGTKRSMEDMESQIDILNRGNPNWYNTGAGAETKLQIGKAANAALASIGLPAWYDPVKLAAGEDLMKQTKLAGLTVLNALQGAQREAAQIITSTQGAVPNIENTPQGAKLVLHGIREAANWTADQHTFMANWYNEHKGNMVGADVAFNQARPSQLYARRGISMVRPYEVSDPSDFKRYLPGTQVYLKGTNPKDANSIKTVPGEDDLMFNVPTVTVTAPKDSQ